MAQQKIGKKAFQGAQERESLIFQWFWEVLGGGPRTQHGDGWIVRPPNTQFQKKTPNTMTHWVNGNWQMVLGLWVKGPMGLGKDRHKGLG